MAGTSETTAVRRWVRGRTAIAVLLAALATGIATPRSEGPGAGAARVPAGTAGAADRRNDASGPFRLTLLGTGNPRPAAERFGPSSLVEAGGLRVLVDAGRGATIRLLQAGGGDLLGGIDLVLLTHLHSDHTVGLPDLWLTGWIVGRDRPLPVHGPRGTRDMARHLERAFRFDIENRRDTVENLPGEGVILRAVDIEIDPEGGGARVVFDSEGLRIVAFPVDHGADTPALGYRFDYAGRSAVFSGDCRPSPRLITMAHGVDVLVHEVDSPELHRRQALVKDPATVDRIIARHTTPEEAGRIFALTRPRLAVYSHIVPSMATAADLVPPTRREYKGRLEVGYDLMLITIGEKITVGRRGTVPAREPR